MKYHRFASFSVIFLTFFSCWHLVISFHFWAFWKFNSRNLDKFQNIYLWFWLTFSHFFLSFLSMTIWLFFSICCQNVAHFFGQENVVFLKYCLQVSIFTCINSRWLLFFLADSFISENFKNFRYHLDCKICKKIFPILKNSILILPINKPRRWFHRQILKKLW